MPGINGYELCTRIRKDAKNNEVKILVVSGVVGPKEIDRILSLGADDYLAKPFDNKQLKMKIIGLPGWNRKVEDK